jgi:hypothetical protein
VPLQAAPRLFAREGARAADYAHGHLGWRPMRARRLRRTLRRGQQTV